MKPFRFLDLPPEIREKIYFLICSHPVQYVSLDIPYAQTSYPHSLLLTNHQIYQEIRPLYFTQNAFSLTIRRRNDTLYHFLSTAFQDYRREIRSLRIIILRWGSKNFFLKTLVPIIDDCILNGRLRELDIVISSTFLKQLNAINWDDKDGGATLGEEYDNWKGVRKLLGDPYLEMAGCWAGDIGDLLEGRGIEDLEDGVVQNMGRLLKGEPRKQRYHPH